MFDVNKIREQFPILKETVYGKPLVYLDNAATSQKPQTVLESIIESYTHYNANIHRGVHHLSQVATERHEEARKRVARFINAPDSDCIVFTRGTTEAINMVASSYGRKIFDKDAEIIVSQTEHHSNIVPWQLAGEALGLKLRVIPLNEDGSFDMEAYEKLFNDKTRMVAVSGMGNVMGIANDVCELTRIAHKHGVRILIDGAQMIAHKKVDVQKIDCDFFAFSAHKVYGPNGMGVLYGKRDVLEEMSPYQGGGEMIQNVSFEKTTYNVLPYKFEAGTPDYIGSVALSKALDFVEGIGFEDIHAHELHLTQMLMDGLATIPGMRFYGTAPTKSGVVSFNVDGIHNLDIGMLLDRMGIAVRTGHHCAEPLMDYFGVKGTLRASLAVYNTEAEVEFFLEAMNRVIKMF